MLTLPWVRKHLGMAGCYKEEREKLIIQVARMAVWNSILKARENDSKKIDYFAYHSFVIYKNKTNDCFRKLSGMGSDENSVSVDEVKEKGVNILPPSYDDYGKSEEKRKLYRYIFLLYLDSLLNSEAFPPRCLALFYARILPHLLSEIPDTKAASAKWAFNRMEKQSIWQLTQDSGTVIKKDIANNMKWGGRYMEQLNDEIQLSDRKCRLRDVIFTIEYNVGQIEDWAEYMHKITLRTTNRRILKDKELLELVKDYTTDRVMQKIVQGLEGSKV